MRCLFTSLFAALLVCALCVRRPVAQDTEKAKDTDDKPREFSEEEFRAADNLRLTLSTEQQLLYNGLRYLMRPAFEAELMKGRRYQPCTLPPFEDKTEGPLDLLETLRFWAVLQSGMPVTGAMDRQLQRLLDTPLPAADNGLAVSGVRVLALRAAFLRAELGRGDEIRQRVKALLSAADACKDATSDRSPLLSNDAIQPRWFANHMWRALLMRAGLELGLEIDDRLWEKDLRALTATYVKDRGWTSYKRAMQSPTYDLHTNIISLCALGLARGAPEEAIGETVLRAMEKKYANAPRLLARLETEYESEPWVGSRLLLLHSLAPDCAPERKSADTWRADLTRQGVAVTEPAGLVWMRHALAEEIGLCEPGWTRAEGTVCETALTCLGLSGGLFATGKAPLAGRELGTIGRILYAFALLHANRARQGGSDFDSRVNFAIQDGAAWLASIQEAEGGFPGVYKQNPGNSAYCLLAMMHGGIPRDDEAVKRGIKWILEKGIVGYYSTYDVAAMLMCLQKYYEPEQRQAGILYIDTAAEFEEARRKVWGSLDKEHARFIEKLVKFLDGANVGGTRGGWGYGQVVARGGNDHSDNSCSQYAVLGYKAASLLGAELSTKVFEEEAERLISQYWEDERYDPVEYEHQADDREGDESERKSRKTKSSFSSKIKPGGWSYMCGTRQGASLQLTAAGISSLTICMDELKVRGKLKEKLAQKIGLTIRGAEGWMRRNYYKPEQFTGAGNQLASTGDGWGIYYNLYSVERGCVLAGIRKLEGETDWYMIGAEALIDNQNTEGSWGGTRNLPAANRDLRQVINTCLAILFLKRAAMPVITEHKKREQEAEEEKKKDEPKNPVTGK
ncbi:MAG: hypothetical protein H6840_08415 [Planctomycetes bacterium]|nr:hypothetical protein [Planctomycetota bacterium]